MSLNQKVIDYLETIADNGIDAWNEDFNAYEASGGNFDDAYNIGVEDGRTMLARELLELIKKGETDG